MPVLARYFSALRATLRGSREYASRVNGSCTKKLRLSVLASRNGSMHAVSGSGSSTMSDSWMAWNPRIDEPSKATPLSNRPSSSPVAGMVKCCMTPGRSQNRTSTYWTSSSLASLKTSSGVISVTDVLLYLVVRGLTLWSGYCPSVNPLLRRGYLTMPPTKEAGSPAGSIVGPWTARSYLVRSGGAADSARPEPNRRKSRAKPQETADDAGITPRISRRDTRVAGERAGIVGADGTSGGGATHRLADLLRPGGPGVGLRRHLQRNVGDVGAGHLVRARRGGRPPVWFHTRPIGAGFGGGGVGRTPGVRPVGGAGAARRVGHPAVVHRLGRARVAGSGDRHGGGAALRASVCPTCGARCAAHRASCRRSVAVPWA